MEEALKKEKSSKPVSVELEEPEKQDYSPAIGFHIPADQEIYSEE